MKQVKVSTEDIESKGALFALQNCVMRKLNNDGVEEGFLLSKSTNAW